MNPEIQIEITSLPEATVRLILSAAAAWQCTVDVAIKRLLNRAVGDAHPVTNPS